MTKLQETVGEAEFSYPGENRTLKTWYKVFGDISKDNTTPPLIILHGGPGAGHDFLLPFVNLYTEYSIPLVFYDQIGNGRSTHLKDRNGDIEFWTPALFLHELENLITHLKLRDRPAGFSILGQSWGGMLGAAFAATRPKGLQKLILANSYAGYDVWVKGCNQLVDKLPAAVQKTIRDCEAIGAFESKEYEEACMIFYKRHLCRLDPWPKIVADAFETLMGDSTVYETM